MSSQGLTAENVVRSYLNCLATGDVAGILALHTDDSVIDMPGTAALPWAGRWVGIEKIREYFQVLPSVMEIRSHTQRLWVVDGDKVVTRWTGRGTQTGEFMDMPPTGKKVTVPGSARRLKPFMPCNSSSVTTFPPVRLRQIFY